MKVLSVEAEIVQFSHDHADACALWLRHGYKTLTVLWRRLHEMANENGRILDPLTKNFNADQPWDGEQYQLAEIKPQMGRLRYVFVHPNPREEYGMWTARDVAAMTTVALEKLNALEVKSVAMNGIQTLMVRPHHAEPPHDGTAPAHPLDDTEDDPAVPDYKRDMDFAWVQLGAAM